MNRMIRILGAAALLCVGTAFAQTDQVDNYVTGGSSFTATTPRGVFRCQSDAETNHRQVLTVGEREVYRQPDGLLEPEETNRLSDGILDRDGGCPWAMGSSDGLVLLMRSLQPPHYGIEGLLLVDFTQSDDEAYLIDLGTARTARGESTIKDPTAEWHSGGLVLHFTGDLPAILADGVELSDSVPSEVERTVLFSYSQRELQDGDACLALRGIDLFGGDVLARINTTPPEEMLPEGVRIGAPRMQVINALQRHGRVFDPYQSGDQAAPTGTSDRQSIALCGDAYAVMPVFTFQDGTLARIEFIDDSGQTECEEDPCGWEETYGAVDEEEDVAPASGESRSFDTLASAWEQSCSELVREVDGNTPTPCQPGTTRRLQLDEQWRIASARYCLDSDSDGTCLSEGVALFQQHTSTPGVQRFYLHSADFDSRIGDPDLLQTPIGTVLVLPIAVSGTGGFNDDRFFLWQAPEWRELDATSWQEQLAERLPEGLSVRKGIRIDLSHMHATTPLFHEEDGNCCPSGGTGEFELALQDGRLVLRELQVRAVTED